MSGRTGDIHVNFIKWEGPLCCTKRTIPPYPIAGNLGKRNSLWSWTTSQILAAIKLFTTHLAAKPPPPKSVGWKSPPKLLSSCEHQEIFTSFKQREAPGTPPIGLIPHGSVQNGHWTSVDRFVCWLPYHNNYRTSSLEVPHISLPLIYWERNPEALRGSLTTGKGTGFPFPSVVHKQPNTCTGKSTR